MPALDGRDVQRLSAGVQASEAFNDTFLAGGVASGHEQDFRS